MSQYKTTLWIARALIFLNALVWIGVGLANIILYPRIEPSTGWILVFAAGFILFGTVLAASAALLGRWRTRASYYLASGLMALTVILFIFDDFGWIDLLAMLPALMALGFLVANRKKLTGPALLPASHPE